MTSEDHFREYGSALQVHRLNPGSPYVEDGCVTLCVACHGRHPRSPRNSAQSVRHRSRVMVGFNPRLIAAVDELGELGELWCSTRSAVMTAAVVAFLDDKAPDWRTRHGNPRA